MTIVSAFLMPGNPLPLLKGENPPWKVLADAARKAGAALRDSRPDVLLIYSTQWIAVLDELWQTRPHSVGRHVDENWYEYGDLQMDLHCDVDLALACIDCNLHKGTNLTGIDPQTGALTRLFHPRKHPWHEHFELQGNYLVGKTGVGRTTVRVLSMNSDDQVALRTS